MLQRVRVVAGRAMIGSMQTFLVLFLLLPLTAWAQAPRTQEPEQSRPWAVYFSPEWGATRAVVEALGRAREHVRVQTVVLNSPQITTALVDAHQRGVDVEVILGGRQSSRSSSAAAIAEAGIRTLSDAAHKAATTNAMVIDGQVVITGSFSFAPSAEGSLLVIHDPTLASRYRENWQLHAAHSERYPPKP
jgi:phosphatidylserine/phosphatidylglycerophosphate/cardiolipin synthase-like enzyme